MCTISGGSELHQAPVKTHGSAQHSARCVWTPSRCQEPWCLILPRILASYGQGKGHRLSEYCLVNELCMTETFVYACI